MSTEVPSTPLKYDVFPVTSSDDFVEIAAVEHDAFGSSSPIMELMFPSGPNSLSPAENAAFSASTHVKSWADDPSVHYYAAKLPNGRIIGVAKWNFFLTAEPQDPFPKEFAPGANLELCNYFFGSMNKNRNEGMKGKKHGLMAVLVVSPEFQRMGVGNRLLEWGLRKADEEELELWIDASPYGKPLYEKFKWKEVAVIDVDLGKWGGEEGRIARTVCMVRLPQPIEKKAS